MHNINNINEAFYIAACYLLAFSIHYFYYFFQLASMQMFKEALKTPAS